jgi:hypothetical protein
MARGGISPRITQKGKNMNTLEIKKQLHAMAEAYLFGNEAWPPDDMPTHAATQRKLHEKLVALGVIDVGEWDPEGSGCADSWCYTDLGRELRVSQLMLFIGYWRPAGLVELLSCCALFNGDVWRRDEAKMTDADKLLCTEMQQLLDTYTELADDDSYDGLTWKKSGKGLRGGAAPHPAAHLPRALHGCCVK